MEQKTNAPVMGAPIPQEILNKLSKNKTAQYQDMRAKVLNAGVQFYKAIKQVETWAVKLNDTQKEAVQFILGNALETMPLNYKHAYMLKRMGDIKNIQEFGYREFNFFQELAGKIEVRGYDNAIKLYDAISTFNNEMNDIDMLVKQQQTAAKIFQTLNAEYGKFCNANHVMPEDLEEMANGIVYGTTTEEEKTK